MDNVATTASRSSPAYSTNPRLLLLLSLSLSPSPASKVIAKKAGGKHHRARGLDGGGAFRCRTCGRCFATFQALGGHRTSHNRPRVRADGLDLLLGARPGKGGTSTDDIHRCNTCSMVFPTGQALGGHMRRHRVVFEVAALETTTMLATTTVSGLSEEEDDDAGHVSSNLIQFL